MPFLSCLFSPSTPYQLPSEIAANDSAERFSKQLGVDVYLGSAKFLDKRTVEVNGQKLTFARCTIATGGSPRLPKIDGIDKLFHEWHSKSDDAAAILTNESIFNLVDLPPRLGIIGNGKEETYTSIFLLLTPIQKTITGRLFED